MTFTKTLFHNENFEFKQVAGMKLRHEDENEDAPGASVLNNELFYSTFNENFPLVENFSAMWSCSASFKVWLSAKKVEMMIMIMNRNFTSHNW